MIYHKNTEQNTTKTRNTISGNNSVLYLNISGNDIISLK